MSAERTGTSANPTNTRSLEVRPGEDEQADMSWGGPRCDPYAVYVTGQVISGPCWVYAVRTNTTATSTTLDLYDGTSTSGTPIFRGVPTATINVAGFRQPIAAEGVAVYCPNGLYASVGGSGSPNAEFIVYAFASQP